ncbi:MAG: hypothetical protein F9K39_03110 [Exiguobacterium chiriqhucha]|uniref:WapI family immunity protein n=1 Tax=Exiguobacterium chiriqhucha TaxID=1385984 RepID=UPI00144B9C91|nr:hypothetical protein [Exiguobacterium chiriqhucha]KAB2865046.1 MAG: hypothetical protein F9K39_03110 [Exiguobacterium chiriqhucha]
MAKIQHKDVTIELLPRKYSEKGEDVFIASLFTIEVDQLFIFKFYGSLLLKSEFQDFLFHMRRLLESTSDKYLLNPIEPYFVLRIERKADALYKWTFWARSGPKRVDAFFFPKEEMEQFYKQLEQEMTDILPLPFLP